MEVPTVAEAGVPGYESTNWYAMFAPAKASARLVTLLYREVAAIAKSQELRRRLIPEGQEPLGTTPHELDAHIAREITKWTELAKAAGLSAN